MAHQVGRRFGPHALPALVLASASPRRHALLGLLGVPFTVDVADVDESERPGEAPRALALRLARLKARTVAARHPDALVLAADTVVALGGILLGKPATVAEAHSMLTALRGRPHRVFTGLAVAHGAAVTSEGVAMTTVRMRSYGIDEVERYVASGRSFDKAGGYGIQDADFRPVAGIDGCFPNVVGLPLCEVRAALARAALLPSDAASGAAPTDPCALCVGARAAVEAPS